MTEKDDYKEIEILQKPELTWKTQEDICQLSGKDQSVISKHIKNILENEEINSNPVYALHASTGSDGKTYQIKYYCPEIVTRVLFRVKSGKGAELQKVSDERTIKDIQKIGDGLQNKQELTTSIGELKEEIQTLKNTIENQQTSFDKMMQHLTISYEQQQYLQELGRERVVALLGGKDTPEYKKDGRKYFKRLWIDFNHHYKINTHKNLNPTNYDKSKEYIQYWTYQ